MKRNDKVILDEHGKPIVGSPGYLARMRTRTMQGSSFTVPASPPVGPSDAGRVQSGSRAGRPARAYPARSSRTTGSPAEMGPPESTLQVTPPRQSGASAPRSPS